MKLIDVVRRLHQLGHAPEFPQYGEEFLNWTLCDLAAELIRRYQRFHGLPVSGRVCPETESHLKRPRCAHPDVLAVTGESRWALGSIEYFQQIAYPGVDPAEIAADYAEAVRRMSAVCGITISPAASPSAAQVLAVSAPIDGQWNVLALTELPPPDAGQGVVLHQTFDVAETGLTKDQRIAMMAHEAGHYLGLGHATPGSGNLMEPVLGSISSPQAWDTQQLQERYPLPAAAPNPGPATTPTPDSANAGPAVTSVLLSVASAGSHEFTFNFDVPGSYLVLVVPQASPGRS